MQCPFRLCKAYGATGRFGSRRTLSRIAFHVFPGLLCLGFPPAEINKTDAQPVGVEPTMSKKSETEKEKSFQNGPLFAKD